MTDSELFAAFGQRLAAGGNTRNPRRYHGQVGPLTDAPNRIKMGHRIYDPETGVWYSLDPIGFLGSDWNLLRFVGNDPVNDVDPMGLWSPGACFHDTYAYYKARYTQRIACRLSKRWCKKKVGKYPSVDCSKYPNKSPKPKPRFDPSVAKHIREECHDCPLDCQQCLAALADDASFRNIIAVALSAVAPGPTNLPTTNLPTASTSDCALSLEPGCNRNNWSFEKALEEYIGCVLPGVRKGYLQGIVALILKEIGFPSR